MTISAQTLVTLEFPKILERLAQYTSFSASRELALALLPSTEAAEVRARLQRTAEARTLLNEQPDVSIGGARDVRTAVSRAQRGGVLDAPVFLEIVATLDSGRRLRVLLRKLDAARFPQLSALAEDLPNLPEIEEVITRTIGDDGAVLDSASPKLAQLRGDIRVAFNRLQERLQNIITSSQYADALQEPIITVRGGRYVVPVKAAQRRVVRGLVHDQSSSGATLYIEPLAVVEQNNRWRELQSAEEQEIARILAELSGRVGAQAPAISAGVTALAAFDLALAQAKYADALRCVQPEMSEQGLEIGGSEKQSPIANDQSPMTNRQSPLLLTRARHPLLNQATVVPTDLELGGRFRLLLITGPNTGGKTVALKTTGLLALMAQAGLHIPADAPSRLPVFAQVFADIGDEQSIEQSLSTFSSHMSNIIRILAALEQTTTEEGRPTKDEADGRDSALSLQSSVLSPPSSVLGPALVLLDELGAGTDPLEGAALARAIIERLLALGVLGVATTHYAELKAFAYTTEGVENGSVEFNVETLAPTYRLTVGIPGRSNALAIAARLGLEPDLVARARSTIRSEEVQVEDLLATIQHEREAAEAERARAETLRDDAEKYRDRLATELAQFERQREAEWQAARDEVENDFREARNQIRRLRDDFRSVSVSRQWMEQAEQRLQDARGSAPEAPPAAPKRTIVAAPPAQPANVPRPVQVGDTVRVRSVGLTGEVLTIDEDDQTAEVQVGGFRMQANLRELTREKGAQIGAQRASAPASALPPPPDVEMSFDIRGWRAGEVADKLERYLNDAYLAGLPFVRIIHGKGTGALRQIVRETLTRTGLVASFEGGGQDGGEGVTVAQMNNR